MNSAMYTITLKFMKFCIVGFCGMLLDFGITYLCKEKFKIQKYVANAIGFMVAATANYFFNRIWTFQSSNPGVGLEYSKFILVSSIGLGINSFFLWLFINKLKKNFYFAKLIAIVITTIWNFTANLAITFV